MEENFSSKGETDIQRKKVEGPVGQSILPFLRALCRANTVTWSSAKTEAGKGWPVDTWHGLFLAPPNLHMGTGVWEGQILPWKRRTGF